MFSCWIIAIMTNGLIENCASIGGVVNPSDNYAAGICGIHNSIALGLFNSTAVVCQAPNRYLPNTGGVFSVVGGFSYASFCANEGDIFGRHLTGGIAGYNAASEINNSINSGFISGSTLVGQFPTGGIMQTTDFGAARNCYYVIGKSAVGGRVFSPGVLGQMAPLDEKNLRNKEALSLIGEFDGDNPAWAFASLDANGPIPFGIFKEQTASPQMPEKGGSIVLPNTDGIRYFYTLDGSDPYTGNVIQADGLTITLSTDQILMVYAARQGCRDSNIVSYSMGGGK